MAIGRSALASTLGHWQDAHLDIVDRTIALMAFQVLVPILESCDEQYKQQWESCQTWTDGRETREELQDDENCGEQGGIFESVRMMS
jgi:hypothetical protein